MEEFSKRLNKIMNIRGIRQIDLANRLNVNRGLISQYLNGRFVPNQNKIYLLSQILNVNPAWLMGFDVSMDAEVEKISENDFIYEVNKLIDNSDLEQNKKDLLKQNIKYICGDKE